MSLAGRARSRKGTTVSVYRQTEVETGDGGVNVASWSLVEDGIRCVIASESDDLMQKVFGTPEIVKDRAWIPAGVVIEVGGGGSNHLGPAGFPIPAGDPGTESQNVLELPDVKVGDALVATAGLRSGQKWRVRAALRFDQARGAAHLEAALEATTETIP